MGKPESVLWALLPSLLPACAGHGEAFRAGLMPRPRAVAARAADRVLADHPTPPGFNWGEGVLMAGMLRTWHVTKDPRALAFVRRWADRWRPSLGEVLEGEGMRPHAVGYCGRWGPGFPLLLLHEATGDPAVLDMARTIAAFMREKATRTREGGFGHWRGNRQLWADTLYMSCPLLACLGRIDGRPELQEEAASQLLVSARRLQDPATGLFYHQYDEPQDRRTQEFWGRGNGWVAMSFIETLREVDGKSPLSAALRGSFRRHVEGLRRTFDPAAGSWHTVLDNPASYVETSATAMILYGLIEGERLGFIKPGAPAIIERAWKALAEQVDAEGRVRGVSAATGPTDLAGYVAVPRGSETWGTGALLLAAAALAE